MVSTNRKVEIVDKKETNTQEGTYATLDFLQGMSIKNRHQSHQSVNTMVSLLVWYVSQEKSHTATESNEECMVHHQHYTTQRAGQLTLKHQAT